jgi:hypothetical protein
VTATWRITLVEQPPRQWEPGKAKPPEGLWDFTASEGGLDFRQVRQRRQDVTYFEGTAQSRGEALAKAKGAIDAELERRSRYEELYYPDQPEEATE